MNKLTILTLLTLTYYSCTTGTKEESKLKKIVITPDSCTTWGLPPVNFEIEYPNDFTSEITPAGGFYLQLRKLSGDTILQEISFGRVDGPMDDEKVKRNLTYVDSVLNKTLNNAGQDYKTNFIGSEKFNDNGAIQLRSTLRLINVRRDRFVANGEYKTTMTCVYSPTSTDQAIMVSVLSSTTEPIDSKTIIGTAASEILKSLKMR